VVAARAGEGIGVAPHPRAAGTGLRLFRAARPHQRHAAAPEPAVRGRAEFLVDLVAPFNELDWAQVARAAGLANFDQAYAMIKYRKDRIAANQAEWPAAAPYTWPRSSSREGILRGPGVLRRTAGKAKGIPTIMFRGAGLDGRHAWFGYLDATQRWQLDCVTLRRPEICRRPGLRSADVEGHQRSRTAIPHGALPRVADLQDLGDERAVCRGLPARGQGGTRHGRRRANRSTATRAISTAWNILLEAQAAKRSGSARPEALMREAVLAFQRYPDLEISFSRQLVESLRARGETSLAQVEEQRLGQKYQVNRTDLSIEQAAATLKRSVESDDVATQIRVYNRVLDASGRDAGTDFMTRWSFRLSRTWPRWSKCRRRCRRWNARGGTLHVEPGKQMDAEMTDLANRLKKGDFPGKSAGH